MLPSRSHSSRVWVLLATLYATLLSTVAATDVCSMTCSDGSGGVCRLYASSMAAPACVDLNLQGGCPEPTGGIAWVDCVGRVPTPAPAPTRPPPPPPPFCNEPCQTFSGPCRNGNDVTSCMGTDANGNCLPGFDYCAPPPTPPPPPTMGLPSRTWASCLFIDIGEGCCGGTSPTIHNSPVSSANRTLCENICASEPGCVAFSFGWNGGTSLWCATYYACQVPLDHGSTACGSSGSNGVHTYQCQNPASSTSTPLTQTTNPGSGGASGHNGSSSSSTKLSAGDDAAIAIGGLLVLVGIAVVALYVTQSKNRGGNSGGGDRDLLSDSDGGRGVVVNATYDYASGTA